MLMLLWLQKTHKDKYMRLTIVTDDMAVYTDIGVFIIPDISGLIPEGVSALQWYNGKGWIEFKEDIDWNKPNNQRITELPTWAIMCQNRWEEYSMQKVEEKAREPAMDENLIPVAFL